MRHRAECNLHCANRNVFLDLSPPNAVLRVERHHMMKAKRERAKRRSQRSTKASKKAKGKTSQIHKKAAKGTLKRRKTVQQLLWEEYVKTHGGPAIRSDPEPDRDSKGGGNAGSFGSNVIGPMDVHDEDF